MDSQQRNCWFGSLNFYFHSCWQITFPRLCDTWPFCHNTYISHQQPKPQLLETWPPYGCEVVCLYIYFLRSSHTFCLFLVGFFLLSVAKRLQKAVTPLSVISVQALFPDLTFISWLCGILCHTQTLCSQTHKYVSPFLFLFNTASECHSWLEHLHDTYR